MPKMAFAADRIRTISDRAAPNQLQIRAGRALLRWSAEDLARESNLGVTTIRPGLPEDETSMTTANDLTVRRTFAADVEFIDENGGGPGVRRYYEAIGAVPSTEAMHSAAARRQIGSSGLGCFGSLTFSQAPQTRRESACCFFADQFISTAAPPSAWR
jgi:hypothetical protein